MCLRVDGATSFNLAEGTDFVQIPVIKLPSQLTLIVLFLVSAAAAAGAFWFESKRLRTPLWIPLVVGSAFVLGFLTWVGAGKSSLIPMVGVLAGSLSLAVPLIFGAMSGILCERSGTINIAIEGQLLSGAFLAAVVASATKSPWIGLLAAPLAGLLFAALLALFAVKYRVDQIIVGVVLNVLAAGLTGFLFSTVLSEDRAFWNSPQTLPRIPIPLLHKIPVIGPVLFKQTILVYLMFIIIGVLQYMLFNSRWGLRMRACGEHPKAADTVGIKVNRTRVNNVLLGGALAGLGGAFFTIGSGLAFTKDISAGNGFIALAAMILGKWNPRGAVAAALLFGFSKSVAYMLSTIGAGVPSEVLLMVPYIITILAVAGFVGKVRAPAAEGVAYP
ncbi:MAG: ABC transporter permease [Buchananella hordeovulneris]|nr:ABC transporter permease [Buchananella hordeovulneris]